MEGKKQSGSSFTADLFGSQDSSASPSSGVFGSIFAPPSRVVGREHGRSNSLEMKQDPASQVWTAKTGPSENVPQRSEVEWQSNYNRDFSSHYQEQRVQPCHLSSSIYYGGQDDYSRPSNTQNAACTTYSKDAGEDDSDSASRGNWWQGSLYY